MSAGALLFLADAILVLHVCFALFVAGGLVAVWIGAWLGTAWVRGRAFRIAHLSATGVVALESLLGLVCPLTEWESGLREVAGSAGYAGSFVGHWLGRLLYYDFDERVFLALYLGLLAAAAATWRLVPPRQKLPARPDEPR